MDDLSAIKQLQENQEAKAKKEPTTAELFAASRRGVFDDSLGASAKAALFELERRMGAMALILRKIVGETREDWDGWEDGEGNNLGAEIAAALTDAHTVIGTPCDCSGTLGTHEAGAACIMDECSPCSGTGRVSGGGQHAIAGAVEDCGACGSTGHYAPNTQPVFTLEEVKALFASAVAAERKEWDDDGPPAKALDGIAYELRVRLERRR